MKGSKATAWLLTAVTGVAAAGLPGIPMTAQAAVSYPVQEFRLALGDTDNNVTADGALLAPAEVQGTANEKWHLNYVSSGVFEIVNGATGQILTASGTGVSLAADSDGAAQRWKIEGVQKDCDGYYLYYKITSNADSSKALTYKEGVGFMLASYSGDTYQKYKINLDGLEGWAANAKGYAGEKAGTVGGLFGDVVYVSTADELEAQLKKTEPLTVVVTGDIDMQKKSHTRIRDNKTLVGCYGSHTIYDCQLRTNNEYGTEGDEPSDNIVIRNLKMIAKNSPNRILINVWSSRQIWIDHIFFDNQLSYDRTGNGQDEVGKFIWINTPYDNYMDAKDRLRSPDYVTISYCHLKKRYWTVAYGTQNDEITRDRTTLLYNWWDQNVRRCPQLGNGSAHVYDNYYSAYGKDANGSATSGIIGGDGSDMVSENNYFNGYTKSQALMMGGGSDPCRDSGSYLSEGLNATPSAVSFSPKTTSTWYPKNNYGYSMIDAYNTKNTDSKAFCTKYAGDQTSASGMKYITDSEFDPWITTRYACPFLRHVELKTKTGAVMDTAFSYTFRNVNSGLYLAVTDETAASGANVGQGKPSDKAACTWTLRDAGDGYYYIYTAMNQNLCIDLPYGSTDNGTSIGLWSNDESDARKFKFVDNGDGSYTITTKCTGDQSCFGVIADSKDEGADVIQWTCTGNNSQKWYVSMVLDPLQGELIRDFDRLNNTYAGAWAIKSDLQDGALLFGDREVTYTGLPEALLGAEYVMTPCDAKNLTGDLAEFTAAEDLTVYAAFDARVTTPPAWLSDWTKTELTFRNSNDVQFVVYAREVQQGERVTLGENGQSSGCVNYTVMAVKKAEEQALTGDIDDNGVLGVTDAVMLQKWLLRAGTLTNGKNADINGDGIINVIDLTLLKRMLTA
ncbi:MAG: RICIN domain-containing protein [Oscillospiraceae bacterium]|nr:RICIN domain-containing protein [Oscillospiraceae bacterium]